MTFHLLGHCIVSGSVGIFAWLWGHYAGRTDFEEAFILNALSMGGPKTGLELGGGAGHIYGRLQALERRGLIHSWEGIPLPQRGGRPRRYYALTSKGYERVGGVL